VIRKPKVFVSAGGGTVPHADDRVGVIRKPKVFVSAGGGADRTPTIGWE